MKIFGAAATSLLVAASVASTANAQEVISLHGSGTTNPSRCYWQIMDQMQAQAKLPVKMTYRGVGSSTGQAEFVGDGVTSFNMFGSGDIPITQENYDKFPAGSIIHLPVVLGAISFFHSVPVGDGQLNVSPCLLAKIMSRKITDWTDQEVLAENPGLTLPSPSPITVARRVRGSSSTSSITKYLNQVCPSEWPAELVGSTIDWPADTAQCEGSGGMTECIRETPGTIGYIEAGHGHAEKLQEIELLNAAGNYISSKEAAAVGGILAAAENAALPATLSGSFADVNFLNQGGTNTWPIVALSYIYVKSNITFIENPASQTLLKAFLKSVYTDEYITQCEQEFGFVRIAGDLRTQALDAIDSLVTTAGAPEWTFEFDTAPGTGQGDFVISGKRNSYSEIQQASLVASVTALTEQIAFLESEVEELHAELDGNMHEHNGDGTSVTPSTASQASSALSSSEADQDSKITASLVMSSISFAFWIVAIVVLLARSVTGSHIEEKAHVSTEMP
eukprot:CAMPEP_0113489530 /NCGR_PEP_ID=MMETSP0014_2-20120614/26576_1 /TAXON_ID=2857 /ORGANISM="Nitzschia sp." /LENGTH=505 /DNA_ID=CAMNT_0000383269 /DNA_START=148 /DNA_END=1665 /DNA_ORIENTATION=- /assembly_acc=CAM_ASM_000159